MARATVVMRSTTALCAEIDPELWFPYEQQTGKKNTSYSTEMAKQFCSQCPLTLKCLMVAVSNREEYGIWGGTTPRERRYINNVVQGNDFVIKLKQRFSK